MGPAWTREAEAFEAYCSGAAATRAPYIWGGKGDMLWTPQGLKKRDVLKDRVPFVYDCSGLLTCAMRFSTGNQIDLRASHSATAMWRDWPEALKEDLLTAWFFGSDADHITHVEFQVADGFCYGARGGNSDMDTLEKAIAAKACAQFGKNTRLDYQGARKIPRISP